MRTALNKGRKLLSSFALEQTYCDDRIDSEVDHSALHIGLALERGGAEGALDHTALTIDDDVVQGVARDVGALHLGNSFTLAVDREVCIRYAKERQDAVEALSLFILREWCLFDGKRLSLCDVRLVECRTHGST